jgi:tripartite-type tricarboxylate transporter receptor subunit TctC
MSIYRRHLPIFAATALLGGVSSQASAQPRSAAVSVAGWPSRPVRLIAGFAAGGLVDVYARLVAERYTQAFGQPFLVENRPGGGGTLANELVARADDGHTFLATSISMSAGAALRAGQIGYDVLRDFAPVSLIAVVANAVLVHPSVPASTIGELVGLLKAQPRRLNCGSPGSGTSGHLAQEYFKLRTGTDFVHVPYRGTGPLLADFLGGQVQIVVDNLPLYMPYVRDGQVRLLAVTTPERWPTVPHVPTVAETVAESFSVRAWFGVMAPARTPVPVLDAMNATTVAALAEPRFAEAIRQGGAEPWAASRAEFSAFLREDMARWTEVVRLSGARPD